MRVDANRRDGHKLTTLCKPIRLWKPIGERIAVALFGVYISNLRPKLPYLIFAFPVGHDNRHISEIGQRPRVADLSLQNTSRLPVRPRWRPFDRSRILGINRKTSANHDVRSKGGKSLRMRKSFTGLINSSALIGSLIPAPSPTWSCTAPSSLRVLNTRF